MLPRSFGVARGCLSRVSPLGVVVATVLPRITSITLTHQYYSTHSYVHHHITPPNTQYPSSPAYYTGNHKYYDLLYSLQISLGGVQAAHSAVSQVVHYSDIYDTVRKSFKSRDVLSLEMNLALSQSQYDTLINHLTAIRVGPVDLSSWASSSSSSSNSALNDKERNLIGVRLIQATVVITSKSEHITRVLKPFLNPIVVAAEGAAPKKPDRYGRTFATGSRKTSRAHAWVIPGDGQFCVNGIPVADYFLRREVESVTFPLQVAQAFGKFNVWAVVLGGGPTGQADAAAVAVARALAIHLPSKKDDLEGTGLLKNDTRQVERKKPGQKKARKKFAWVKR